MGRPPTLTNAVTVSVTHTGAVTTNPKPLSATKPAIAAAAATAMTITRAAENPKSNPLVDRRPKRTVPGSRPELKIGLPRPAKRPDSAGPARPETTPWAVRRREPRRGPQQTGTLAQRTHWDLIHLAAVGQRTRWESPERAATVAASPMGRAGPGVTRRHQGQTSLTRTDLGLLRFRSRWRFQHLSNEPRQPLRVARRKLRPTN
jgi:hypothetical protein